MCLFVCPSVTVLAASASVFLDSSIFEKTSVQKLGYEKAKMQVGAHREPFSWTSETQELGRMLLQRLAAGATDVKKRDQDSSSYSVLRAARLAYAHAPNMSVYCA